ncbi:MAG: tetratricopeptide repeat protein [Gemmatimonadota bacterium]
MRWFLSTLLVLVKLPVLAHAQSADHMALGVSRVQARDPEAALMHFQAALADDSTGYEANWRAALAAIDIGKQTPDTIKSAARDSLYAQAERYARRATLANPAGADGHFVLAAAVGRASLTKGKRERVRRAVEIRDEALRAIELDPRHDGAYHVMGRWNAEIMRLSGFERFFARSFLGGSVFNQASWAHAAEFMEKAVSLAPTNIYHHLDLALVYIDRGRYTEARAHLNQIATLPVVDVMDPRYIEDAGSVLTQIDGKKDK